MRHLNLIRSCASSPDNSLSDKSFLMLSNHLRLFSLPLLFSPATSITLLPTYSSSLLNTCPYHFNLLSCTFLDISPTFAVPLILSFLILSELERQLREEKYPSSRNNWTLIFGCIMLHPLIILNGIDYSVCCGNTTDTLSPRHTVLWLHPHLIQAHLFHSFTLSNHWPSSWSFPFNFPLPARVRQRSLRSLHMSKSSERPLLSATSLAHDLIQEKLYIIKLNTRKNVPFIDRSL